jgi:hypothetical protein
MKGNFPISYRKNICPVRLQYCTLKSLLLKVGDIIYIKSFSPGADITVKAIGIICDSIILDEKDYNGLVQIGRNVS